MYRVLGIEKHLMCVYATKYNESKGEGKLGIFKTLKLTKKKISGCKVML